MITSFPGQAEDFRLALPHRLINRMVILPSGAGRTLTTMDGLQWKPKASWRSDERGSLGQIHNQNGTWNERTAYNTDKL